MYNFLKDGTLPDDEANQYVLMNDILYHLFTKRLRKNVKETDIFFLLSDMVYKM
jgi:hypothetical protein